MTYRGQVLENVKQLTEGSRNKTHGDPVAQHACVAALWNTYIEAKQGKPLDAKDAAQMLVLLKVSRQLHGDGSELDHYADQVGYAAISAECVHRAAAE